MYAHHTHQVDNRIVSLSEPFIGPIKRGKATAPVEFGPKIDCSIMDGIVDIEHYSYQAFNEIAELKATLDHYQDVHGYHPDIALADTLYRTKENITWCKKHHIALNGPRLGRKHKHIDPQKRYDDQKAKNRRGAIEREFAFIKAKMGLNEVTTKKAETIAVSIDCAVVVADLMNYLRMFDRPIALDAKKDSYLNSLLTNPVSCPLLSGPCSMY